MNRLQILTGDCRQILPTLESESVQTCVCSPPYWGLRDYGTAQWEGGNEGCDHKRFNGYPSGLQGSKESTYNGKFEKQICGKCGARRIDSQLGLEFTPEEYLANMVAVFREVWRVLRNDGTLWVNCGDSYIAKNLCMMPARLAMALQADGWYLRSEIIWAKPNPMPESVTDRPTKSHEYIFLLTKSERYFYDAEAIKEPANPVVICPGDVNGQPTMPQGKGDINEQRNKRSVWTIATQPYAEAHFATFPEEIPKLCILAGSKLGDTVLDPFAGSGTTGKVALELGRRAILIELNPDYIGLAHDRSFVTPGFL